jgi:hypothetical protein
MSVSVMEDYKLRDLRTSHKNPVTGPAVESHCTKVFVKLSWEVVHKIVQSYTFSIQYNLQLRQSLYADTQEHIDPIPLLS